jgi:hypothetical protein
MRLLIILLFHPTYLVRSQGPVPLPALGAFIGAYLLVCGMSFSYLFPRLLNKVPWLGFFRKMHPGTWNPRFDPELFIRGALMGSVVIGSFAIIFTMLLAARGRRAFPQGVLFALGCCIPILITCAVGFLFHYLYPPLGLAPVFGLFASTSLQAFFLRDLCGLHRALVIYLSPTVTVGQLYLCFLLLP